MAEHHHLAFFIFFFFAQAAMAGWSGGGEWRVLRESIGISAMHMQLMRNDKVAMFDRTDFGASNLSLPGGRCRQDPLDTVLKKDCTAHSLFYDVSANAVAPLTVLTDTWCSSGAVLPDGTLLQSGGYNDGDRVVRSLAPCAFHGGATAACDWVEHPGYLAVRRWYATNQILPDGRVVIVGGRRQYSYEFFPREEEAQPAEFPFLRRPGMEKQRTTSTLSSTSSPTAPSSSSPTPEPSPSTTSLATCSAPSQPSPVASPQLPEHRLLRAPPPPPPRRRRRRPGGGGAHLRRRPAGNLRQASPHRPESFMADGDHAGGPRYGDMLLLPTGDVIIVNGAGKGTAGWELGRDPVTFPLLYRPDGPSGGRFSVLSRSGIPRMYHSAAMVDTLGRVLVGGSNPHIYYNFTGVEYPTELRLEAFYPPYLDAAYDGRRPTAVEVVPRGAVGYGEPLAVSFEVAEYESQGGVVVALLAPSFTTHSLAMNQRMVVLAVEKVESAGGEAYQATTAAPPSANIAPPGYYLLFVVHAGVPSKGVWINIH
ncbi:unnamed protein product [Spirodela intermedia]|uniref:Uncharacterized protein n=1 Tax=Spirodela intermedia TaxID=51605 RepID=A0A7I8ITX5_SPIIN|nr:unnamed protein product [Spirodela intermedia]CAA6660588.1 unnamed protein product [Spirodela intermedia]